MSTDSLRVLVFTLAVCAPGLLEAQLVLNGSFESGLAPWMPFGAGAGALHTLVPTAHGGSQALRIDNRTSPNHAANQPITARLTMAGSGLRWTTRFWIRSDQWVSARLALQIVDAGGPRTLVLAGRMVRDLGVWVEVEESQIIAWQGTLTSATLFFEIGQLPEAVYPGIVIDDVSIDPDADGDLLTDAEELLQGTNQAAMDSDGDGLEDAWELDHGLDPTVAGSGGDLDGDGYVDHEEFWAATDPQDPMSWPGKCTDPAANARVKSILSMLALLPSRPDERVILGQHSTDPTAEFTPQVAGLAAATGQWPALFCTQYDDNANPLKVAVVNPYVQAYWDAGGLVLIKWSPRNPFTGGGPNDLSGGIDMAAIVTPGTPANTQFQTWLSEVGDGLEELRDGGVVVLFRPMSEMNGSWFWWGHRTRDGYVNLWRYMHTYLTQTRGLHNLIWVYESDRSIHPLLAADYYYPGDDVVDVVGHNCYLDDWIIPFDTHHLWLRYPKIVAFPQAGVGMQRDGSWDNLTAITQIAARYPRISFYAHWNTFVTGGGTVTVNHAIVDNQNAPALVAHPWIVTRDDLDLDAVLGDVDRNGRVDVLDALAAAQIAVGLRALPDPCDRVFVAADVTRDTQITVLDALAIAQFAVGILQTF